MGSADLQQVARPRATAGDPKGPYIEHVAIILSEVVTSTATWALDIQVQLAEGSARGTHGRIVTSPLRYSIDERMGGNKRAARVVALASCPGAVQWFVDAQIAHVYGNEDDEAPPRNNRASLWIEASPHGAGAPLVALEGSIIPTRRFFCQSFAGAGSVELPPAMMVQQISILATAGGAGAILDLPFSNADVAVPAGGAFNMTPNRVFNPFGWMTVNFLGDVASWYVQGEY